ncbi:MAG TPA: hypothetical protein VII52_06345 [Gemmatimonadaceae bacterium]
MTRSRRWLAASMLGLVLPACSSTTEPLSGLPVVLTERVFAAPPPIVTGIVAFKDTVIASTVQQPSCAQTHANAGIQGSRLVITLTLNESLALPCALISGVVLYTLTVHGVPPGHYLAELEIMTVTAQATTITPISSAAIALP